MRFFSRNVFSVSAVKQLIKADHKSLSAIKCGMCKNVLQSLRIIKVTMIHPMTKQIYLNLN